MEIIERILRSSRQAPDRTVDSVFKHLVEEVGELSRALNRPWRCEEPAMGEIADVMNCAVDLAYLLVHKEFKENGKVATCQDVQELLTAYVGSKCDKWDAMKEPPVTDEAKERRVKVEGHVSIKLIQDFSDVKGDPTEGQVVPLTEKVMKGDQVIAYNFLWYGRTYTVYPSECVEIMK